MKICSESTDSDPNLKAAAKAGQFAKTGILAVMRIGYITVLLVIAITLFIGLGSLFTWSNYLNNLRETLNVAKSAATAVVGLVAASVAVDSLHQKRNTDDRDAALARLQWAMDLTTSDFERERNLGWNLLAGLVRKPGLLADDTELAQSLQEYVDEEKPRGPADDDDEEVSD